MPPPSKPPSAPPCPHCGGATVLRVAGTGSDSGDRFWSCSRYPACRGARPYEEPTNGRPPKGSAKGGTPVPATTLLGQNDAPTLQPRPLAAAPAGPGLHVEFFESVALPASLVAQCNLADVDPTLVRRFAGWRLDSPVPNDAAPDGTAQALLSLAEELLLKGTTPLAFVTVERWLEGASKIPWTSLDPRAITSVLQHLARSPSAPHRPGRFDSSDVGHLVRGVADANLRAGSGWSLHANVSLSSLVPGAPPESSCDLLMTRADGEPVVVNLGGTGQRAIDGSLRAKGYDVIRIPVAEFQARGGVEWSRLEALFKPRQFGSPPAEMTDRLRMFRAVHQLQVATIRALRAGHLPARGPWRLRVRAPEVIAAYPEAAGLFRMATSVVSELLLRLSKLWSVEDPTPSSISVDLAHRGDGESAPEFFVRFGPDRAAYYISDAVLPLPPLRLPTTVARLTPRSTLSASDGEWFLRWIYRKPTFREGQWECVRRAIQGQDTLLLLPLGPASPSPISSPPCCARGRASS